MKTNKKIEIIARSLSMNEFDAFQDYIESIAEMPEAKQMRKLAIWIGENVYKLDTNDPSISVATFMKLLNDTMELTNKNNDEEIKNLKTSGNGVSVVE